MHVDDCADALVHVMKVYSAAEHINIGTGEELTIAALARLIADVVGFSGELVFDPQNPMGRRASSWTGRSSPAWAGVPASACATVSLKPTRPSRPAPARLSVLGAH